MGHAAQRSLMTGRRQELRRLNAAMKSRKSLLIWGAADSGKTTLAMKAIEQFPQANRDKCIYWAGPGSLRELLSHIVGALWRAGDPYVRKKLQMDGGENSTPDSWLRAQSSLRLRGIAFSAMEREPYWLFLDYVPPASHAMAHLLKEFVWRCKTPVYLLARGCTESEIGWMWSLYWTSEYRIGLPRLTECEARQLFEKCVRHFGLAGLELDEFREEILRRSGHQPGSIVKMCEMAAKPRYQCGEQIKVNVVHVDYLMQANLPTSRFSPDYEQ